MEHMKHQLAPCYPWLILLLYLGQVSQQMSEPPLEHMKHQLAFTWGVVFLPAREKCIVKNSVAEPEPPS